MKLSLRNRLIRFLQNNPDWHSSGSLQRLVTAKTSYTASNATRRLRKLQEENIIEVDYRTHNGTQHAFYRFLSPQSLVERLNPISDTDLVRLEIHEIIRKGQEWFSTLPE